MLRRAAAGRCNVAVVGAGPFGLSVAAHLRAADGLSVRVFGPTMSFWQQQMPTGMLLRSPARLLVWLWPAMMTFTVMTTANHYWLDGLGGAVAAGIGLGITLLVFPRLERPWSRRAVRGRTAAREVAVS